MLILLGILVLCAVVLPRVRLFKDPHARQFGYMSERWLTEYRASEHT